eukprot:TRINITY_DN15604_c0_g1_i1.p2 TRINITY_DN15604_c0_g1~~TRINITY_DN15604_c0_g1_i1.p2  ORF type:complete len:667 (+),score=161.38 TRINITY_DN15604_c0_g1_i1:226-2001(+)
MVHVQMVAFSNPKADLHKLTNGIDWQGHTCGVGEYKDKPFLYWCVNPGNEGMGMSLTDGICVETCPKTSESKSLCPLLPHIVETKDDVVGKEYEWHVTLTRKVKELDNVPSFALMEMYCVPNNVDEVATNFFKTGPLSGASEHVVMALHGVWEGRFVLAFVALCVLGMSFSFLYVLTFFVQAVILAIIAVMFVGLFALGTFFTYTAFSTDGNIFSQFIPHYAFATSLTIGGLFYLGEIIFCCFIFFSREAMEVTCSAVRKACDTIKNLPTLMLEPVMSLCLKAIIFYWLLYGMAYVASQGEIVPATSPMDTSAGVAISGVMRKIQFESWMYTHILIWVFGSVWIYEMVIALSQYSVSHAVVIYHLNRDESCRIAPLSVGVLNGLVWHLGTLAFGSFVIGVLRCLTAVCAFIAKQTRAEDGSTAVAAKVACCCCSCCLKFLTNVMRMTNEMAYVDVAIQGSDYPEACKNVAKLTLEHPMVVANITGMTKAIRLLGTTTIGFLGTGFAYWLFTSKWLSVELNTLVKGTAVVVHTSSTLGATIAAALISFGIGTSFMVSFDTITDTLAYCILWQKHLNPDAGDDYDLLKTEEDY